MSHFRSRFAVPVMLLCASILALTGQIFGEDVLPRKSAPWNIQSARQKYYSGLDAARQEAIRQIEAEGLTLSYNADGTAIHDDAFDKATQYYNQKQQSLLSEVRSDSRRDEEFKALSESAGATVKREGGAQPGEGAYSGALSDRDVELNTKAQVENLTEAARKQGYHVVTGPGYVKILELDTVVWEPFRSHGPGGVELRHDDPEVMLSYEVIVGQQKASVTQQVKKIEDLYREEIPGSTQKQHELVASVAKAVAKSADAIGQSVSESGGVLDRNQLNEYKLLKSRKLTKDDLISPFDKPEAQERQLNERFQKGRQEIQACDGEQARQRDEKLKELKAERTTLATKMLEEKDDDERRALEVQIMEIDESTRAVEKSLSVDAQTRRAIARKNPKLATAMGWNTKPDTVIPDQAGELARTSRVIDEALEISKQQEPRDTSATEAFDALADANRTIGKVLNSPFFKIFARVAGMSPGAIKLAEQVGKTSKAVDKNVISPTQKAIQSEGFVFETGDGMKEYIARRLKEEAAQGWDITDPRRQELIRQEAVLRATGLGTYEGAKFLPGLGNIIQGYENTFHLTESSVGLVYDTWKSQQTAEMNRFQQEGQLEQAIIQAKESRDRLRKLMDTAAKTVAYSKEIEKLLPSLNADIEQLQQQIKDRRIQLESLAPVDGQASAPESAIDPQLLSGLRARMETLTRLAKRFTADCEKAIARVNSGKVPREELLEERNALQRRLMDEVDAEYIRIEALVDQVNARIQMVTEPAEVQKVYDALLLDYGQALALASTAEEIASRLERNQLLYKDAFRCFTEERKRILAACDFFATRAVGDENLQKRLSQMRGEMTEYHIADYQLPENWTQTSSLKREATWLRQIAAEPPKPPKDAVVSPTMRAEVEQLQQQSNLWKEPEAAMTAAVDEARAKFRELQDLLPLEPPAFSITADQLKPLQWKFTVESIRVPEDAKLVYSWDFGDGAGEGGPESRRQHLYAKPGEYTVRVRAFLERADLSEDLGEVSTRVVMGDPLPNPPGKPEQVETQPAAGQLRVGADIQLDGAIERSKDPLDDPLRAKVPVGQYTSDGGLWIGLAENGEALTGNYSIGLYLKLNEGVARTPGAILSFNEWSLFVNGTAQGRLNRQSGTFLLNGNPATWEEHVGLGVDSAAGGADARQLLGVSPEQLGWTGEITGKMDWKNFGGGQGRIQINKLVQGTWKVDPIWCYSVGSPSDASLYDRLPQVRIYRNEALAIKGFTSYAMRLSAGVGKKNIEGFGDQAVWSPGGMLVRTGRWHIDYWPNFRSRSPETFRDSVTRIRQFIQDSQLDTTLPILPDP
ncbi:MAG: PKD domain-containing protein [Planctomycetota bacterium]|nr:MAG: PKD domain-containing protein [Planctomycetota bacterium]